jgi:GT2 family glycosyltransferase
MMFAPGLISVVMPYWRRQEILYECLESYRALYPTEQLEIVVVDDGSPEPVVVPPDMPWPVSVVSLPRKFIALNPCVPFNSGVSISSGEFVVLTNPENVHRSPILGAMRERVREMGAHGHLAAACWDGELKRWLCHSTDEPDPKTVGRAPIPAQSGLHFCAMLHRQFYDDIGGFDEAYRNGRAYDDNDLLWKLHVAGATFAIADDLITDHKPCPRTPWHYGSNKDLFESKWSAWLSA